MKNISAILFVCVAFVGPIRADYDAVLSAAREFRARCDRAIPDDKRNDAYAIGHILHLRLSELDEEVAVLEGLQLQLAAAKGKNELVSAYCSAFTVRSLDMLDHLVGQSIDSLKIAGIAVPADVSEASRMLHGAIQSFYQKPQKRGSLDEKKNGG